MSILDQLLNVGGEQRIQNDFRFDVRGEVVVDHLFFDFIGKRHGSVPPCSDKLSIADGG